MTLALDTQLWVDHKGDGAPRAEGIVPVRNEEFRTSWPKPARGTGMWTSTHGTAGSWLDWMRQEGWFPNEDSARYWLIDVAPSARVYVIDSVADLEQLIQRFPKRVPSDFAQVDWAAAGASFDGIHLTVGGQWATRLQEPNLYGWDCESTLWFRWAFTGTPREISKAEALAALPQPVS